MEKSKHAKTILEGLGFRLKKESRMGGEMKPLSREKDDWACK